MEPSPPSEHRLESRNNIFVMATVYAGGGSTPVRVRNISRSGALIEATDLPPAGTSIRLSRGSLEVMGNIMWVDVHKAGLRFATSVRVADWLPQGKRGSGQQLVDEMVHQARLGPAARTPQPDRSDQANLTFADELSQLRYMLERAGEDLASDSAVTTNHPAALQFIDGVAQSLARLAEGAVIPASPVKFSA